ncbi:MAG TPA: type I-E CRISPR-associated protein Cse1/CasA, partial [Trueperaceae bacterium]
LFDHGRVEGATELPLDRAACYLLAHQAFALGGGVSKPFNRMDAPLTKGFIVEVMGSNLFETLALNVMTREYWERITPDLGADKPFWEEDAPPDPVKEGTPIKGPLHYLTWQSRRVHLVVDVARQLVTGCQIAQRYCLPKDGAPVDPGKCYYRDDKKEQGWQLRRLRKDRAAWRLTHVLLQSAVPNPKDRLVVLSWLTALRQREKVLGKPRLPSTVSLAVSGLTTDPKLTAKIDLWRREEIGLPVAILDDPTLVRCVSLLMQDAARVESLLRRSSEALVWATIERAKLREAVHYILTGNIGQTRMPPEVVPVAGSLGVTLKYWAAMEGPFRAALFALPETDFSSVRGMWHGRLERTARGAFNDALLTQQGAGAPWELLSRVRDAFERRLTGLRRFGEEETGNDDAVNE